MCISYKYLTNIYQYKIVYVSIFLVALLKMSSKESPLNLWGFPLVCTKTVPKSKGTCHKRFKMSPFISGFATAPLSWNLFVICWQKPLFLRVWPATLLRIVIAVERDDVAVPKQNLQFINTVGKTWCMNPPLFPAPFWAQLATLSRIWILRTYKFKCHCSLVGGFNESENFSQIRNIPPNRGENKKYLKPPPSSMFNVLPTMDLSSQTPNSWRGWTQPTLMDLPWVGFDDSIHCKGFSSHANVGSLPVSTHVHPRNLGQPEMCKNTKIVVFELVGTFLTFRGPSCCFPLTARRPNGK